MTIFEEYLISRIVSCSTVNAPFVKHKFEEIHCSKKETTTFAGDINSANLPCLTSVLPGHTILGILFFFSFLKLGGSSYHGASGGSAYGKVDGTEFTIGSGGGGANGGAGGNFIKIDIGDVC